VTAGRPAGSRETGSRETGSRATQHKQLKRLLATVLIMEMVVVGLSIPVAIRIDHLAPGSAATAGGIAAGGALLFAVLARRLLPVTLAGGSLLQIFVIASGAIVPVMYVLGGIFAAFWIVGIWLGNYVERPARS
jgi:hypothetical protein